MYGAFGSSSRFSRPDREISENSRLSSPKPVSSPRRVSTAMMKLVPARPVPEIMQW